MWFGVTEDACAAFLSVTPSDASDARAPERSATPAHPEPSQYGGRVLRTGDRAT
jgi:hypothetical protein